MYIFSDSPSWTLASKNQSENIRPITLLFQAPSKKFTYCWFVTVSIMETRAKKIFKGFILLEVAGVIGAYALFHKMNRSQDFRYTMNKRFPSVLEVFYKSNEWAGVYGIREQDAVTWSTRENKS
ncbi:protein CEBPZOS [Bombina bombina]|uniref:protein CEBPZOS n=1 Tax=Bombina bombina TaxID=8345 RepID=UPI00235B1986|nr:protein CEBPZOS [Bombina bombina]